MPDWNISYEILPDLEKCGGKKVAHFSSPHGWVEGEASFRSSAHPDGECSACSSTNIPKVPVLKAHLYYNLGYMDHGGDDPLFHRLRRAVGIGVLGYWGYFVREGQLLLPKTTGTRF